MQLLSKSAAKGGGARSRRAVGGDKGVSKAAANALRLLAILAVIAWTVFVYLRFSELSAAVEVVEVSHGADSAAVEVVDVDSADPCRGRYIYVHDLPPRFNADLIRDCRKAEPLWGDMCGFVRNAGLGRPLADRAEGVITGEAGWYGTHQFALDFIFHNRMKQYECLTNNSAVASAVFVPFYAGFEFARYHWGYKNAIKDAASLDLSKWLMARPQWRRMGGRDHFLVAGRTGWDFFRSVNLGSDWGNDLLAMPAGRNMSVLVLESTFKHRRDYSVPYPTYFHPRSDADVLRWQDRVRGRRREWLMAFVGAPRPDVRNRIRDRVIAQCKASTACALLACAPAPGSPQCHAPGDIMRLFQKATFCLQPQGDSWTRRSVFDAMVAGCIPVFFHPATAYKQYRWHLPEDHLNYSVYIPDADVRRWWWSVRIEDVLRAIPPDTVERMREEVIKLIPRVLYADPRARMETIRYAFDVAVEGVLDTVARIRKGEYVDSGRPITEDPPNLYVSTQSRFGPEYSAVSKIMVWLQQWIF